MPTPIAIAIALLASVILIQSPAAFAQDQSQPQLQFSPRQDFIFSKSAPWKFIREDVTGAQNVEFDDARWQSVTLPHTWNAIDGQSVKNYYRGPAWYRTTLAIGPENRFRRILLKFEAASIVTSVYVNGNPVGSHRGAFGAFCVDLTPELHFDSENNTIAIRVDNAPQPDVAPLSGDFTIFGGIYRDVHLLVLSPFCIDPLDDASPGVYLLQEEVSDALARVKLTTRLRNFDSRERSATVRCTITDAEGNTVVTSEGKTDVPTSAAGGVVQSFSIPSPHLWNGRADPYLYHAAVELVDGNTVVDKVEQPLGLRYFKVDPEKGFILNGKPCNLHGVNRHQDRIDKGWAVSDDDHKEDFDLIMDMGCSAVRLAHYQHAEYFYSLCDRGGLVVWAELCLVDKLSADPAFAMNASQQLRELVKQNFNHPCICFWAISNELWQAKDHNAGIHLTSDLNALAKQLDPSRPTTCADNGPPDFPLNAVTDLLGFNRYWGWYDGGVEKWAKLDDLHAALPGRPLAITEYGAGASIHQHEASPAQPPTAGPWHPEEYQSLVHEAAYNAMKSRPWLWGTFVWNMFDFASPIRREGEYIARNDKGLMTYDRVARKDAFYFYKANWSADAVVHITSRRFNPRPSGPAAIKVYSNLDSVELTLNGKSLGAKTSSDHIFIWPGVTLIDGDNTVVAAGASGPRHAADKLTWTCAPDTPAKLGLPPPAPTDPAPK